MPPHGVLDVSLAVLGEDNVHLAVLSGHAYAEEAAVDAVASAHVGHEFALRLLGDHGGGNDGLALGEHGVPLQEATPAVIIGPVSAQTIGQVAVLVLRIELDGTLGALQGDGLSVNDIDSLLGAVVLNEFKVTLLVDGALAHGDNNVGLILVAPVDGLAQGHVDLVALDGALYPANAEHAGATAEDVLHVNGGAVLGIDDVHAVAGLLTVVEIAAAVVVILTSAVVALELASGLLGDDTEAGASLCLLGIELNHLLVDLVALQGVGALEVNACRCADSHCSCNQKYR